MTTSRIATALLALTVAATLAACGDTWRGAKTDTGQNMDATGRALERGGDKVNPNK